MYAAEQPRSHDGRFAAVPHAEPTINLVDDYPDLPPEEAAGWRTRGVPAEVAEEWHQAGFTPAAAAMWTRRWFQPREAADWFSRGFGASGAAGWRSAGFSPARADLWEGAGFDRVEATELVAAGTTSPPADPLDDDVVEHSHSDLDTLHEPLHAPTPNQPVLATQHGPGEWAR